MSRKRVFLVSLVVFLVVVVVGVVGVRFFTWPNTADGGIHADGVLVPVVRRQVFYENGIQGTIEKFDVNPGDLVPENRTLMHLHDVELEKHLQDLMQRRDAANLKAKSLRALADNGPGDRDGNAKKMEAENQEQLATSLDNQIKTIRAMIETAQDAEVRGQTNFVVKAPRFNPEEAAEMRGQPRWTILNKTFKEDLTGKAVRPSDPLLRLGAADGPWELEIRIPQKDIGAVELAYQRLGVDELDVEFHLRSDPSRTFQGKLRKEKIASEAGTPGGPIVAYVRIEGNDIEPTKRLPAELRISGTELDAKVRGDTAR